MNKINQGFLVLFVVLFASVVVSDEKKGGNIYLSERQVVKVWENISGGKPYVKDNGGHSATFERGGHKWTIILADLPIVNPTVYPKKWPVKENDFDVLVIPEPITNYKILPFTERIENAVSSDKLQIIGAPDSFEPASFVIRSGQTDLQDVMVEASDLVSEKAEHAGTKKKKIPKENIDVRIVKCWYQSGRDLWDIRHKTLTPELLLHDDDLVRVDHENQANLVRDFEAIKDADTLRSFSIPAKQNRQIWITVHLQKGLTTGKYTGRVRIHAKTGTTKDLTLSVDVFPFTLADPIVEYALYYDGYLARPDAPKLDCKPKSQTQMLSELKDMKEHGLTNVTVKHQISINRNTWEADWKTLERTLALRKEAGFGNKPLLYVDWRATLKSDLGMYKEKIRKIIKIANASGIRDIYIYGIDERKGQDLLMLRSLYNAVHEAGAKNFVACQEEFLLFIPDLLDLPIIHGQPNDYFMKLLRKLDIPVWSYANPQAGREEPETYRRNYGIKLYLDGFAGACNFIYQGSYWIDVVDDKSRSHTMAYPTIDRPIPTIQWEGWREGVNDMRYLTLLKLKDKLSGDLIGKQCLDDLNACRKILIQHLLNE